MTRRYLIKENLNTRKPFIRNVDDMYNYSYCNVGGEENYVGVFFEITEKQANHLESLKHFMGEK